MSIRGALLIVFCTIAAQAHSPGTAKAFLDELTESQPALTKKLSRAIPDMIPKAYRVSVPPASLAILPHAIIT